MMSEQKTESFEEKMNKLDSIVKELENDDVSLEKSLELYKNCLLYTSPSPRD